MSASVSVYLVSASPGWTRAVSGKVDETAGVFDTVEAFLAAGVGPEGGMLLLDRDLSDSEIGSITGRLVGSGGRWSVFLAGGPDEDGDVGLEPVPLPGSCSISLADVASRLRRTEEEPPPLELCQVLSFVARARHDINNPLTSALAETQLLLLDAEDPEVRSGLETVEEQLRRIRDLVARLQALPRPGT